MVVRSELLWDLPAGLVNDGAYIAGRAYSAGYLVKYLRSAHVMVEVPSLPMDVIRQRRRILYGHMQVWKLLGNAPRTTESQVVSAPRLGIGMVVATLARHPRLILSLPVAVVCEVFSFLGASVDMASSGKKHAVWQRFGG